MQVIAGKYVLAYTKPSFMSVCFEACLVAFIGPQKFSVMTRVKKFYFTNPAVVR